MIYTSLDIMSAVLNKNINGFHVIYRKYQAQREVILGTMSALALSFPISSLLSLVLVMAVGASLSGCSEDGGSSIGIVPVTTNNQPVDKHGDNDHNATLLTLGLNSSVNDSGTLHEFSDLDVFRSDLPVGKSYQIEVSSSSQVLLVFTQPDGTRIDKTGNNVIVTWDSNNAGVHYFSLETQGGAQTATYTITLTDITPAPQTWNVATTQELKDAVSQARANDTVVMAAGTYVLADPFTGLYLTQDNLTVKASPGAEVIINNAMLFPSLIISGADITVEGITFATQTNLATQHVLVASASNTTIRSCRFHGLNGIEASNASGINVVYSTFTANWTGITAIRLRDSINPMVDHCSFGNWPECLDVQTTSDLIATANNVINMIGGFTVFLQTDSASAATTQWGWNNLWGTSEFYDTDANSFFPTVGIVLAPNLYQHPVVVNSERNDLRLQPQSPLVGADGNSGNIGAEPVVSLTNWATFVANTNNPSGYASLAQGTEAEVLVFDQTVTNLNGAWSQLLGDSWEVQIYCATVDTNGMWNQLIGYTTTVRIDMGRNNPFILAEETFTANNPVNNLKIPVKQSHSFGGGTFTDMRVTMDTTGLPAGAKVFVMLTGVSSTGFDLMGNFINVYTPAGLIGSSTVN